MLLRGSSLKNTAWIYGIVVYTGHETKIMKNSIALRSKLSKLERATNRYILLMVLLQVMICSFAALYSSICTVNKEENYTYLDITDPPPFLIEVLTNFGTWFIIFMNLVPISLMVTLEIVKFF